MSQQELLKKVIQALEGAGIEYMVSGSLVSSLQGEPRSTHDIDVVVAVRRSMAKALVRAFPPPNYYLTEKAFWRQFRIRACSISSMLTLETKVDFWVLTDDPI